MQLLPHQPLECGRPDVERQIEVRLGALEVGEDCVDEALQLSAFLLAHPRGIELGAEVGCELGGAVAERHTADPPIGRGHQQAAQGRRHGDKDDVHPGAAAGVRRGRHAELLVRMLVDSARGAVSGFIECGTHVLPPFQFLLEARAAVRLGVGPRRDPQNSFECAREPAGLASRRRAGGDCASGFAHQCYGGVGTRRVRRMTAAARAEPLALGSFGDREKRHLGAPWAAAGAGRAAVDAGRADGVDERSVEPAISCQHRLPPLRGTHGGEVSARPHRSSIRFVRSNLHCHGSSLDGP